jgi:eukaryotic-like serine/threonine-protein kinase
MNEEEIFHQALARSRPEERAAYLDQACAGDRALRASVEALLRANVGASGFLSRPALPPGSAAGEGIGEGPGTVIGPYRLMEQIGEGGMGLVFVAEQSEPVRRKVAVKVIKPGLDTREVIARFEAERQALALMDHPNIARLLDGGTTDSGRPYFVMELVKGVPLTQFCDDHRLTPRERLGLFISVCQAVQHAHTKGVIHRDVKPSNVLVTSHDGTPVVKVIDFGVARAFRQPLTDKTVYTRFTQLVGSPLYMSPEQAGLSGLDVDTRTDIYALGVLLYELLTGTTPFEERLREADYDEMRRIIREEEPTRPSARVSTLSGDVATVSANRGSDPKRLSRLLRGELDWVVMKCLEKDRGRRYETANDLALEVQRYLRDEPVLAGPPAAGYRLRKFVRRHRGPVLAAALLLAALLAGLAGTTWGLVRAEWAREEADAARRAEAGARRREAKRAEAESTQRKRAEENERRASGERDRAEEEKQIAEAVRRFLLVGLLRQADPRTQADTVLRTGGEFEAQENPTVKELLDRAAAELRGDQLEAKFPKQPRVQAEVLQTIGFAYLGVGEYETAIVHLARACERMTQALGPDDPRTQAVLYNLAVANRRAGKTAEALALLEKLSKAEEARHGPRHPSTLGTRDQLALAYLDAGKTAQAIALLEKVRAAREAGQGPRHPSTLATLDTLAGAHRQAGNTAEALALLERVRAARGAGQGAEQLSALSTLSHLAGVHLDVGRTSEAAALYEKVRGVCEARLGPGHPETLKALNNLARAYGQAGRRAEALALLEKVSGACVARLGPDHPLTLLTRSNLAGAHRQAGKTAEAIALYEKVRAACVARLGADHPQTLLTLNGLAAAYWSAGKLERSVPLFEEALRLRKARLGTDHPETLRTMANLGVNYRDAGKQAEGTALLEEALARSRRRPGATPAQFEWIVRALAQTYDRGRQFARSEPLYRELVEQARKKQGAGHPDVAGALTRLGWNLLRQRKAAEAELVLRESLALCEKHAPGGSKALEAKTLLGGALLRQKKYAGAEPLLRAGYLGLKEQAATNRPGHPVPLRQALDWLIELAEAQGDTESARRWRKERGAVAP